MFQNVSLLKNAEWNESAVWQDLTMSVIHCIDEAAGEAHMPALGKALLGLTSITQLDIGVKLRPSIGYETPYNGADTVVNSIVQLTTLR